MPKPTAADNRFGVTRRAWAIGLACVVVTCLTVSYSELVVQRVHVGAMQLPPIAVGLLFGLACVGAGMRRLGRPALAPHEMAVVYIMSALAAMFSSRGVVQRVIPLLVSTNFKAGEDGGWREAFFAHIPRWAVAWDPAGPARQAVAAGFYNGLKPGEGVPWGPWTVPLLTWGLFVACVCFAFLCLAVLLRKPWADHERLSFPLVQLPIELAQAAAPGSAGLGGAPLWAGFAVPAAVYTLKGLHRLIPDVPDVVTHLNLQTVLTGPPWDALHFTHILVSFAAMGFLFMLPTDLVFSLWFFFSLARGLDVAAGLRGVKVDDMPMFGTPMAVGYQNMGAYLAVAGWVLWAAREHLRRVAACLRPGAGGQGAEALPYRTALIGLIGSTAVAVAWLALLGLEVWLAAAAFGLFLFVAAVVMARSTAEAGMLMTETSFLPMDLFRLMGNPQNLGAANLTAMAQFDTAWCRDQRGLVLCTFLDGMALADKVRLSRRSLVAVFAVALGAAAVVSVVVQVWLPYHIGALRMYDYAYMGPNIWTFEEAKRMLAGERETLPWHALPNALAGLALTVAMIAARARTLAFPLHPLGYALCGSWTMMVLWFPCLAAWLAKVIVLRWGGVGAYRVARRVALGMVLGECSMAVLWSVPGMIWNLPAPSFPWA